MSNKEVDAAFRIDFHYMVVFIDSTIVDLLPHFFKSNFRLLGLVGHKVVDACSVDGLEISLALFLRHFNLFFRRDWTSSFALPSVDVLLVGVEGDERGDKKTVVDRHDDLSDEGERVVGSGVLVDGEVVEGVTVRFIDADLDSAFSHFDDVFIVSEWKLDEV
jgi:hypothetical protein